MHNRLVATVAGLVMTFLATRAIAGDPRSPNGIRYSKVAYPVAEFNSESLALTNCQSGKRLPDGLVLIVCNKKSADSKDDYGLRIFLIQTLPNARILFQSRGAADNYYINLHAYTARSDAESMLIIAEQGTEYSEGIIIYDLSARTMAMIAQLNVVLSTDGNPSTVIPHMAVEKVKNELILRFDHDLAQMKANGSYQVLSRRVFRFPYKKISHLEVNGK